MTESLQIQFSGSQTSQGVCVFAAGQLVHAKLLLDLSKPMKARSIKLHISGGAEVQWTEKETYSYQTTDWQGHNKTEYEYIDIDFGSCAVYMDHKAVMWTAPADQQQLLEAGHHQFPFTFHIPVNCPPSFEGKYGHIRYSCAVIIDRPWKFDKKTKTVFVVSPFVDLNTVEWALVPVIREVEKKIGFFLFKSGKLTVKLHLPKSGFVAGERIPLKIEIDNGTSKKVRKVKANLLTNEIFTAQRGRVSGFDLPPCINRQSGQSFNRQTSLVVAKLKEPFAVAAHSNAVFQAQLAIPPCVPSFNNCPIIRVDYMLEIEVQTSATFSSSSSASMEIPLLLGTVPVRVSQPQMPISNADPASAVPAGNSNGGMEPIDSANPTAPPPAYEESVLTVGAKSAGKEGEQYTPRYPYFKDL